MRDHRKVRAVCVRHAKTDPLRRVFFFIYNSHLFAVVRKYNTVKFLHVTGETSSSVW